MGGEGGWVAVGGVKKILKLKGQCFAISISDPDWHNSQACRQNQFGSPCRLIDAPQGPQRLGKAPSGFYSVGIKPPVKADLAI